MAYFYKYFIILASVLLASCATKPMPMPAPMKFCGVNETVNCQPITPGMREGLPPRGHHEEFEETK